MKKIAVLLFCFISMLSVVLAADKKIELKEVTSFTKENLEQKTKEEIKHSLLGPSVASKTGDIFFFGRNKKTKKLSWHIYDPFKKQIVKEGACPFTDIDKFAISTNGSNALVYSKYPGKLWTLNTEKNRWNEVYSNPAKDQEGLAISPISSFAFFSDTNAYSYFDKWNTGHYVQDVVITDICTEPFSMTNVYTQNGLIEQTGKTLVKNKDGLKKLMTTYIKTNESDSCLCVIKNRPHPTDNGFVNYIFLVNKNGDVKKMHGSSRVIKPLDLSSDSSQCLLGTIPQRGESEIYLISNDEKIKIMNNIQPLAGKIFDDGRVWVYAQKGNEFNIYLRKNGIMQKVLTLPKPYPVAFIEGNNKLLVIKDNKRADYYELEK